MQHTACRSYSMRDTLVSVQIAVLMRRRAPRVANLRTSAEVRLATEKALFR